MFHNANGGHDEISGDNNQCGGMRLMVQSTWSGRRRLRSLATTTTTTTVFPRRPWPTGAWTLETALEHFISAVAQSEGELLGRRASFSVVYCNAFSTSDRTFVDLLSTLDAGRPSI